MKRPVILSQLGNPLLHLPQTWGRKRRDRKRHGRKRHGRKRRDRKWHGRKRRDRKRHDRNLGGRNFTIMLSHRLYPNGGTLWQRKRTVQQEFRSHAKSHDSIQPPPPAVVRTASPPYRQMSPRLINPFEGSYKARLPAYMLPTLYNSVAQTPPESRLSGPKLAMP